MILIGLVLMPSSFLATSVSYGMPPHKHKPRYPVTPQLRVVLFLFGAIFVALGAWRAFFT
jgi:hypothetical protein